MDGIDWMSLGVNTINQEDNNCQIDSVKGYSECPFFVFSKFEIQTGYELRLFGLKTIQCIKYTASSPVIANIDVQI